MKSVATSRYKKYGVNLASIQSKAEDEFVQDVIYKKSRDLLNRCGAVASARCPVL